MTRARGLNLARINHMCYKKLENCWQKDNIHQWPEEGRTHSYSSNLSSTIYSLKTNYN